MSKKSGHRKIVKKSFVMQLIRKLSWYRIKHKISLSKISAATGISEQKIRQSEHTLCLSWFEIAKILYFYQKWFEIKLIDDEVYQPDPKELEEDPDPVTVSSEV